LLLLLLLLLEVSLWNRCLLLPLMMEEVFSMTPSWKWDSRHGGKLRLVRQRLSMFRMTPIANKTKCIAIILFLCSCCLNSNASS
jgi:hypothetical protein